MFCSRCALLLHPENAPANVYNPLAPADQNLRRRDLIKSIYPTEGFDLLQACSKWCLDGGCHGGQGTPGCSDFMPNIGSGDRAGFIEEYGCSQPGCICDPAKGFYQRTIEDAHKCLRDRCRREGTSDNAFKAEANQVENTIKTYCTSHNITGNFTPDYPALPTSTNTKASTAQENTGWKPQDIATVTISIIACIIPLVIALIEGLRARHLRKEQTGNNSSTASRPNDTELTPTPQSMRPSSASQRLQRMSSS